MTENGPDLMPLANRLIDDIIRNWLDTAHGLTEAAGQNIDDMRYLHLDNYWYTVTPKILDALKRAGMLAEREDNDA